MPEQNPVAIIGMGCLFPQSMGLKKYWQLLFKGKDAITEVPESHWSANEYFDSDPKRPDHVYCTRGGFLPPVEFDPMEFGIPPTSLEATDTSQLLGLLAAKMALEDCGYGDTQDFNRDRTSVILGVTGTQELVIPLSSRLGHPRWRKALEESDISRDKTEQIIRKISDSYVPWQENSFPGLLGNVVAGRICNRLDLKGTNCVVDAACASSMSAVHLALLELESGRSDMVVTGGVDTLNDIFMHMCFSKTHTLSATGDARPFSENADGTVLGEGIGMLVLKRLREAEKDGNRIYAVIKGLGSSSDGKSQSIYAPRSEGQARALRAAYKNAGISPASVEMIEAHGTGTRVGDKVEFDALRQVFSESGVNGNKCALGSVKSMIGHTKASAGSAGLIKTALSLYHKVLPPTLKIDKPDPGLEIENSPFYLNTTTRPWFSNNGDPRRAGISAFGFGGSNFHIVLEEYRREKTDISWDGSAEIIAFSANQPDKLVQRLDRFIELIHENLSEDELRLKAAESRRRFSAEDPYRILVVCENIADSGGRLDRAARTLKSGQNLDAQILEGIYIGGPQDPGELAFVFPGQGSQYPGMGKDIVCTFPEAMQVLEAANRQYKKSTRLSDRIYPPLAYTPQERTAQNAELRNTDTAQPAIGAVSLAMLKVLQDFGISPSATCGHSFGELTALCAAGWIDDKKLPELAVLRGQLMDAAGSSRDAHGGSMLAVQAPLADIEELVAASGGKIVLANRNSPSQGVVSGPTGDILEFENQCKARKIRAVRLPVSAAFHSEQIESAVQPFREALKKVEIKPTAVKVFSNTTAGVYPSDPDQVRSLLAEQLIRPVDFVNEIKHLYDSGVRTFVEIGPKSVLSGLISRILENLPFETAALDGSSGKSSGISDLAGLLCRLAALGYPVNLSKWENPALSIRKSHMNVLLNGANYNTKKTEDRRRAIEDSGQRTEGIGQKTAVREQGTEAGSLKTKNRGLRTEDRGLKKDRNYGLDPGRRNRENHISPLNNQHHTNMKKENIAQSEFIRDAYRVVAEGLKSMQNLQVQTAEAHQKFLETQTEAHRTLQEMMKSSQRLAEGTLGANLDTVTAAATENSHPQPIPALPDEESAAVSGMGAPGASYTGAQAEVREIDSAPPCPPELEIPQAAANGYAGDEAPVGSVAADESKTPDGRSDIEATLLEIVSRLTGYPEEMLGLNMDIEAELGIDSIKRVEILSNLEETIPNLPPVSPEVMGSLSTLGQIAEFLVKSNSEQYEAAASTGLNPAAPDSSAFAQSDTTDNRPGMIEAMLLEVVSQLTGYPEEMLGLDMDIESELGIDSIKRVEILSTLEEKMPGLPAVSPEMMGTLKTLGQIVEFIGDDSRKDANAMPSGAGTDSTAGAALTEAEPINSSDTDVTAALLDVVSQLTGYPPEMLGLDMDIEADLGIDSIKRVEILSTLEEKLPDLPAVTPDMMGSLKTLGQISEFLTKPASSDARTEAAGEPHSQNLAIVGDKKPATSSVPADTEPETQPIAIPRKLVTAIDAPPISETSVSISKTKKVFVTEDHTGLSERITEALENLNIKTVRVSLDILKYRGELPEAAGLIIVQDPRSDQMNQDLKDAFSLAKFLAPNLIESARSGGAIFATVTRLDGAFGLRNGPLRYPIQGGLAGLAKTADLEWENVCCHAIDVAPDWSDNRAIASAVVGELMSPGPVEIGLDSVSRCTLTLEDGPDPVGSVNLDDGDVVVISGGARGVTASAARELAGATGAKLVLLGRSPAPIEEPDWLAGLDREGDIKKAILDNEFRDQSATPADVEQTYKRYMTNREIAANLKKLNSAGANVDYIATDVRDAAAVQRVIEDIRSSHGPISGIIHGAGVLEDRLIIDKTTEQFDKVYETKVSGLSNLLESTRRDPLKYLVLFSSIAARLGNKGQVDYAMANEVLNKIAQNESANRPDCRVISINWGPWDGGMVTSALKREFERHGIHLMPLEYGAKSMVSEMMAQYDSPVEIVIGAELKVSSPENHSLPKRPELVKSVSASDERQLSLSFEREIDVRQYPILQSHIIDGKHVVPLALMTEWFAHGALHENPGLVLQGLDDLRVMKGIRMDQDTRIIRLLAGKLQKNGDFYEVPVELRDGKSTDKDILHAKAKAILGENLTAAPAYQFSKTMVAKAFGKKAHEIYDGILFHGSQLHGIRKIVSCSSRGMVAHISSAPPPSEWMATPLRNQWIADPLVLDCAFQMATVWCFEEQGVVSLPSYGASYRQYCDRYPVDGVTVVLEVEDVTNRRMRGNFTILDSADTIVARLDGYEAIMDTSLFKAFKPQYRASA